MKWFKRNKSKPVFKNPRSVQRSIPIKRAWPGGVLEHNGEFTMCGRFTDINYQASSTEDRKLMFAGYEEILKANDINKHFKITLVNRMVNEAELAEDICLKHKDDGFDEYREEINEVNLKRATEGINNIVQEKYITINTTGKSYDDTKSWFNRVESTLHTNFHAIGSDFERLDTVERLRVFHDFFRAGEQEHYNLDVSLARKKGHRLTDYIAPDGMEFQADHFRIGQKYGRALCLHDYPSYLRDAMISEMMSLPKQMMLSVDMTSEDKAVSQSTVNRKLTAVNTEIGNTSRKAIEQNNAMPSIPQRLAEKKKGLEEVLQLIGEYDQRIIWTQVTLFHMADTLEELNSDTDTLKSIGQRYMCTFGVCQYEQEQAMNTVLPYGLQYLSNHRTLTSENCASFMPFRTKEIWDRGGIIYGTNAISKNLVIANKLLLQNGNAFILGVPGSGKSFAAKYEILNVFLSTDDDIIILDPESEYPALMRIFGREGETIRMASGSEMHINALDLLKNCEKGDDPISIKCEFVLTLMEMAIGKSNMGAIQQTIIDRCTRKLLMGAQANGKTVTLRDLYDLLKRQKEPEAKELATCLELYVIGSLDGFAKETNVDITSRVLCYDIKDLGEKSKGLAMLIVLDAIQNRVAENRKKGKRTWVFCDEAYVLFQQSPAVGKFFNGFWRRIRKYGALGVCISQNATSLLRSEDGCDMLANSEFLLMFNQAAKDRDALAELLNISDAQLDYIYNTKVGSGLMRRANVLIPFESTFSQDTKLYKAMTTKIDEVERYG